MRHLTVLEFDRDITVDEKLVFFNEVKESKILSYTDVSSQNQNKQITIYFSTEDGDSGRAIFEDRKVQLATLLSFDRLVELHEFTATYYAEELVDLIEKYVPPEEEEEEPREPPITA